MKNIIETSTLVEFEDEPRILDVVLAERLGFALPRHVRELIDRNRDELETYGILSCRTTNSKIEPYQEDTGFRMPSGNSARGRGRPAKAYYLNEGQALVICALSRTPKAAQVRKLLIDVFMAYRQGKLVHVKEHRRSLPQRRRNQIQFSFEENLESVYASTDHESLIAGLMTRLQNLEIAAFGEPQNPRQIVPTGRIRGY